MVRQPTLSNDIEWRYEGYLMLIWKNFHSLIERADGIHSRDFDGETYLDRGSRIMVATAEHKNVAVSTLWTALCEEGTR